MITRHLQTFVLAIVLAALWYPSTGISESVASPESSIRPMPRPEHFATPDPSVRPRIRPANLLSPDYRSQIPGASFTDDQVGENCHIYINNDGTYGTHGLMLRTELLGLGRSSDLSEYFFTRQLPGMNDLCPKFYDLNREQKINFWIWFFMSLSHDESKCNDPDWVINAGAPNGVAAGEFQLDESWRQRSWRGDGCDAKSPKMRRYVMVNPANNIPCAVQSLGYSLCGFYSTNSGQCTEDAHAPFGSHLTWARLKSGSGPVIDRIKEFELCK